MKLEKENIEELNFIRGQMETFENILSTNYNELWNYLINNYNGHPLLNLDEFLEEIETKKNISKEISKI